MVGDANVKEQNIAAGGVGVLMQGPSSTPICTLPSNASIRFVGREKERQALDVWAASDSRVLVVHGAPGVGKTRLAVEWAHEQAAMFPDGRYAVPFLGDPNRALLDVALLLGIRKAPLENVAQLAKRALRQVGAGRALVIFDDLQSADAFAEWFQYLSKARAIVVTNELVWPAGYEKLFVDALLEEDARLLARTIIGDEMTSAKHVDAIIERSGRNAVQIVADAGVIHEAVEVGDAPELPSLPTPEASQCFERAWQAATEDARTLLCALALFRAQSTPTARVAEVLAAAGWDEGRVRKAATDAVRRHLVTRDAGQALTLQPLMRTFARTKGETALSAAVREAHVYAFASRANAFVLSPWDHGKYAEIAHDEFELSVWLSRSVTLSTTGKDVVGRALMAAGLFQTAHAWIERAIEEMRKCEAEGIIRHVWLGASMHDVGWCLSEQGKFREACVWYERAYKEKLFGDERGRADHASLAASMHQIGWCLLQQGAIEEACIWFEKAIDGHRQGDERNRINHWNLGASLYMRGICLFRERKIKETYAHFEEAISHIRLGDMHGRIDHAQIGVILEDTGWCLIPQRGFEKARPLFEQAAEERRQGDLSGYINHAALGECLHAVGMCHLAQGDLTEARGVFECAVEEKRLGDLYGRVDHTSLGASQHQVGLCLFKRGEVAEARGWFERAAEEKCQGDVFSRVNHASLGASQHQVGLCLFKQGEIAEARGRFELAAKETCQGDPFGRVNAASLAANLEALAATLEHLGHAVEARAYLDEAVRLRAALWKTQRT